MRLVTRNKFVKAPWKYFSKRCAPCAGLPLTRTRSGKPNFATVFKDVPSEPSVERDLYDPLCTAINRLCPGHVCTVTSESPDLDDPARRKVDLAVYREENKPKDNRQHWADQVMHIEVKKDSVADDPFDDTEGAVFQIDTDQRSENRAQIASYADMLFRRQPRAFCFTVVFFGHYARIIRWDRSGAVVTELIDIVKHPERLAEFFWRFAHMTRAEQGYDTTITPVARKSPEWKKMDNARKRVLDSGDYARQMFDESLKHRSYPRLKIRVRCEDAAEGVLADPCDPYKDYLVGKPAYMVNSVVGRCTRGYVALDADTEEFVWLKDAWRVDVDRMTKEGDTLQKLREADVPNVPTFLCHGDVPDQTTLADKVWDELYGSKVAGSSEGTPMCHLKRHTHYRLVTKEICRKLDDFEGGKELLIIILDCVMAHKHAYEKLFLLHRDISGGNVLIFEEVVDGEVRRRGILADWELAKVVSKDQSLKDTMRQPDRTGTWQFLSALTLRNSRKPLTLQDDLESFHQLIFNKSVCWIPSTLSNVPVFCHEYFDAAKINKATNEYICGALKFSIMEEGVLKYSGTTIKFHPIAGKASKYPMNQFFERSLRMFKAYYEVVKHDFPHLFRAIVEEDAGVVTMADSGSSELVVPVPTEEDADFQAWLAQPIAPQKTAEESPELKQHRTFAEFLNGHDKFISLLRTFAHTVPWPAPDKLAANRNTEVHDPEKQAREVAASNVVQPQSGGKPAGPALPSLEAYARQASAPEGTSTTSQKRTRSESTRGEPDEPPMRALRRRIAATSEKSSMGPPPHTQRAGPSTSQASMPTDPSPSGSSQGLSKSRNRRARSEGSRDAQEASTSRRSALQGKASGGRRGQSLSSKGKGKPRE